MLRVLSTVSLLVTCAILPVLIISGLANIPTAARYRDTVWPLIRSGELSLEPVWRRDTVSGIDTFTDCIAIAVAAADRQGLLQHLGSAPIPFEPTRQPHPCTGLERWADTATDPPPVYDYWRYWWGSSDLLRIVAALGVEMPAYRAVLKAGCYASLGLLAIVATMRIGRFGPCILPLLIALAFGFALPIFGQSLAHAPGFILGVLSCAGVTLVPQRQAQVLRNAVLAAAGGLACYLDLLNGNLLVTLVLLCVLAALGAAGHCPALPRPRLPATRAILADAGAFLAGVLSVAILRLAMRSLATGQTLAQSAAEWATMLAVRAAPEIGSGQVTPRSVAHQLWWHAGNATFPYAGIEHAQMAYMVAAALFVGLCVLLVMRFIAAPRRSLELDALPALLATACAVPLWYLLLPNHSYIHAWMTARLMSVFAGVVGVATALELMRAWYAMRVRAVSAPSARREAEGGAVRHARSARP